MTRLSGRLTRILIAEDDALTALALQHALKAGGYEVLGPVVSMECGLEAAVLEPPELAVLDVDLAGDGSGLDLARHLRVRYGTGCLLMTALPDAVLIGVHGAIGALRKPYEPHEALCSVEVLQRLMAGEAVRRLPRGLRLFTPPAVRLTPPL